MRCWLCVQLVLLVLTAVLSLKSNALNTTTSCTGNETFPYLDRETQSLVDLPCANVCPPTKSTDREILFCYKNCRAFLECQLSAPHNRQLRDIVLTSLQQQQRLSNVAKTCLSQHDTWFFHSKHGFTSCRSACSNNRGNEFCSRNCPDYYNFCVKPNRTSISRGSGGVQQPTTAAAGSNPSHATPSTSSRSIINSQAPARQNDNRAAPRPLNSQQRPSRTEAADDLHVDDLSTPSSEEVKSFSTGYSTWFLVIVIGTVVITGLSVVATLIIYLCLHCRRRRLAKKNNNPRFVPANAEILYWIAHPPETDDVAATTQDSSLCAINLTVGSATVQNVNPEYQHLFDPDAPGPLNLLPDDELEQN